jgi:hypothetical protein
MGFVAPIIGWILDHLAETALGAVATALIGWAGARWRKRVVKRQARKRADDAELRAMDARIARHNQLVDFLDQSPLEARRVLARFVHAETHTLALDSLDPAVALLERQRVLVRGPRADSPGFIALHYFTVQADFWRVMFNESRGDPAS